MATTLRDDLAADYADAIGDYGQSFEWSGNTYPCVRTTAPAALEVMPGGFEAKVSDRITVALADLPAGKRPGQGDLVECNRLQIVSVDANVAHLVLWCAPPLNMAALGAD